MWLRLGCSVGKVYFGIELDYRNFDRRCHCDTLWIETSRYLVEAQQPHDEVWQ